MSVTEAAPRASERAYRALRDEIVRWELAPGTVLAEVELAARLGMSRTPVREALARLVSDGLAVAVGGRGLAVAPMDLDQVRDVYEVRQALETHAARLAARRGDPGVFAALADELAATTTSADADPGHVAYYDLVARLDAAVDAAAGNPYLAAALAPVRTHLARIRRAAQHDPARLAAAAVEHRTIAAAIAAGDADLAAHATHVHLHHSLQHAVANVARTTQEPPA
ncbi:GntR family transcriptional regulator [Xylanimonas oleitrophica]|uniref:GntR family transcriptional regulator n=1 Tax=Xylanimonas oleitrophica TaxID=2607479 RepID=A0A2W5WUY3_9MICO|nr:GntR family transcriptional regulator [Xylanimonas oleitrophica]PZR52066.1 GntR family transcriptional regulator [Xylanimonas oleitrophica]